MAKAGPEVTIGAHQGDRLRYGYIFHARAICWTASRGGLPADIPGEAHPPHGKIVVCPNCRQPGLVPEAGHELDYLPPGTTYDPRKGTYTIRLGS